MQQACVYSNAVYSVNMFKALFIVAALVLFALGCASTDSGHREFVPGKGWIPVRDYLFSR